MGTATHPEDIRMCIDKFVPEDLPAAPDPGAPGPGAPGVGIGGPMPGLGPQGGGGPAAPLGGGFGGPGLGLESFGRQRMALISATLWDRGSEIRCRFMDGDPAVRQKVEDVAHGWEDYANIRFAFVDDADAPVRISFALEGSWSYPGVVAKQVARAQPTMNFGWLKPETADDEYSRVVLHEFGHALGCIHEHQSPDVRIPWDKEAVYAYYARQGWSRTQVDQNLFRAYDPQGIQFSRFDRESIMLYAVDNALTIGDWEVGWNKQLSDGDKSYIRQTYPGQQKPASALTVGGSPVTGEIGAPGEVDRYDFTIAKPGHYVLETAGPTDVVMSLTGPRPESTVVAVNDDAGPGLNARIEADLQPGTYAAEVRHYQPTSTGTYELSLQGT